MRKEKWVRKYLAMFLCAALVLTSFPSAVFADTTTDSSATEESVDESGDGTSDTDASDETSTEDASGEETTEDSTTDDGTTDDSTASEDAASGDASGSSDSVTIGGVTYLYAEEATNGYTQIGDTGIYYAVSDGETALEGTLYGTASLTYDEYYEGYVTASYTDESGDAQSYTYDAITTATTGDYSMFDNMYTDYDEETSTDGYNILGVSNVNIAVDATLYVEAAILTAAGKELDDVQAEAAAITLNEDYTTAPSQYKTLNSDGSYSGDLNVVATVDDATPTLSTGSTWGEYEIDLVESSTTYLRNNRTGTYTDADGNTQTFAVGSNVTGLILTTSEGYSVGLAYLANIWIQPYKLSFNTTDTAATKNIAYSGDTAKYAALVGKTITQITYLTTDGAYVYNVSVYVKEVYSESVTGSFNDEMTEFTLDSVPEGLEDATLTVEYTVGSGKTATSYVLYEGDATTETVTLNTEEIADLSGGTYSVTLSSSNYADIDVAVLMLDSQKEELEALIATAEAILEVTEDAMLTSHKEEAEALLENASATMSEADDLIAELTELLEAYTSYGITSSASANGTVSVASSAYNGQTVTVTVTPNTGSSLSSISAVDASGNTVSLTAGSDGSSYTFTMPNSAVTITATFAVINLGDGNAAVTLGYASATYTGSAFTPSTTVTYAGKTLTGGTDYTVGYSNNVNVGTATVTITGTGNYTGTVTKTFTIAAQTLSSSNVSLAYSSKTYTGSALTPAVTVKNAAGSTLASGTNYSVSYSGNKNVGTATVTITGTGNYTGTITKTFKITKATQSLTVKKTTKTVKYTSVKKKKQTVKAITKVSGAKGKVTYKKTSGKSYFTVNKSTGKITVKKGTKKGTYKIKIKVSAAATSNYKAASKTVTVTIKVK